MAKVLYRKYRSKSLSEIVGQEHITKTLERAIKTNRLSHAYLFTGPRGVGKTSVARILAHEVNKLPYDSDQAEIDIIEIDAASNRRIDEIRHLRDRVYIAPTNAPFKVYIIDEVHMLTKEAFNALLKTLEEPPEHVIFILATTDASKLPETIISRTQRFNFRPADDQSIIDLLKDISTKEKIAIDEPALKLIAEHGRGSYRDSIGLLDQLANHDQKITRDYVTQSLGLPSQEVIENLISLLEKPQANYQTLIDSLSQLTTSGTSPGSIASALMEELRSRLINGTLAIPKQQALELLKELLRVESSADPSSLLEITLLGQVKTESVPLDKSDDELIKEPATKAQITKKPLASNEPLDDDTWLKILDSLKSKHNTLYGIARMAKPLFSQGNTLVLIFDFPFHQKQIKESKNQLILVEAIQEVTGKQYTIDSQLSEQRESEQKSQPDLANINKIFGQTELLD